MRRGDMRDILRELIIEYHSMNDPHNLNHHSPYHFFTEAEGDEVGKAGGSTNWSNSENSLQKSSYLHPSPLP